MKRDDDQYQKIMDQLGATPLMLVGEDHRAESVFDTMPMPELIQVLHDLIIYMTGDPEWYAHDITAAQVVKDWCLKMGAIQ